MYDGVALRYAPQRLLLLINSNISCVNTEFVFKPYFTLFILIFSFICALNINRDFTLVFLI